MFEKKSFLVGLIISLNFSICSMVTEQHLAPLAQPVIYKSQINQTIKDTTEKLSNQAISNKYAFKLKELNENIINLLKSQKIEIQLTGLHILLQNSKFYNLGIKTSDLEQLFKDLVYMIFEDNEKSEQRIIWAYDLIHLLINRFNIDSNEYKTLIYKCIMDKHHSNQFFECKAKVLDLIIEDSDIILINQNINNKFKVYVDQSGGAQKSMFGESVDQKLSDTDEYQKNNSNIKTMTTQLGMIGYSNILKNNQLIRKTLLDNLNILMQSKYKIYDISHLSDFHKWKIEKINTVVSMLEDSLNYLIHIMRIFGDTTELNLFLQQKKLKYKEYLNQISLAITSVSKYTKLEGLLITNFAFINSKVIESHLGQHEHNRRQLEHELYFLLKNNNDPMIEIIENTIDSLASMFEDENQGQDSSNHDEYKEAVRDILNENYDEMNILNLSGVKMKLYNLMRKVDIDLEKTANYNDDIYNNHYNSFPLVRNLKSILESLGINYNSVNNTLEQIADNKENFDDDDWDELKNFLNEIIKPFFYPVYEYINIYEFPKLIVENYGNNGRIFDTSAKSKAYVLIQNRVLTLFYNHFSHFKFDADAAQNIAFLMFLFICEIDPYLPLDKSDSKNQSTVSPYVLKNIFRFISKTKNVNIYLNHLFRPDLGVDEEDNNLGVSCFFDGLEKKLESKDLRDKIIVQQIAEQLLDHEWREEFIENICSIGRDQWVSREIKRRKIKPEEIENNKNILIKLQKEYPGPYHKILIDNPKLFKGMKTTKEYLNDKIYDFFKTYHNTIKKDIDQMNLTVNTVNPSLGKYYKISLELLPKLYKYFELDQLKISYGSYERQLQSA